MLNLSDVNLIIFDLDGTLLSSGTAVHAAVKRAFTGMGWSNWLTEQDIEKLLGVTSDEFYYAITPPEKRAIWQELREKVRAEYPAAIREFAGAFPGVTDTLRALKRRGYRLALYSNSSPEYFYSAITAIGVKDYFDYIECVGDNHLTKPELARKIRERFAGLHAAIVGDKLDDVKAAKAAGALSIGVLYGYGGKEPEQAALTIKGFPDLLAIFDRRLPVFDIIRDEIHRRKSPDKAFVIGINGIDCSGKSIFSDALDNFLVAAGCRTQVVHLDDFHQPREIRYAGDPLDDTYYERVKAGYSFDIDRLIEQILTLVARKESLAIRLTLLNWQTDRYDVVKDFHLAPGTIVILEGFFLYLEKLSPYIDYKVFLEIPFEECRRRAASRDTAAVYRKYETKYLPAQREYLDEYPPSQIADLIVDNMDWEIPGVIFRRRV